MQKKMKQWVALGLSAALLAGACACGGKEGGSKEAGKDAQNVTQENTGDQGDTRDEVPASGDAVTLEWWYCGNGVQADTEMVEDAFNELLKTYPGMENVTVNFNCYPGAEYANAVTLAQSSGQQMDIIQTFALNFQNEVANGTFLPLNDLLAESPKLMEELPDWLWDMVTVDGSVYLVPSYQRAGNQLYFVTPKEYMDNYGDLDTIRSVLQNENHTVAEIVEAFETYVDAVREGTGIDTKYAPPLGGYWYNSDNGFYNRFDTLVDQFIVDEGSDQVEYSMLTQDRQELFDACARWYEEGYIHPDIMTITEGDFKGKNILNDVSYVFQFTNGMGDEERQTKLQSEAMGFDMYAIPINTSNYIRNGWAAGGNGVTAKCAHPDKALRLIELMTTEEGTELYNMVVYGLEGTHYEKLSDVRIQTLEYDGTQGGVDTSYAAWKWVIGNTLHSYLNQGCTDDENEQTELFNNDPNNVYSPLMGFMADTSEIETELEQCKAVYQEYFDVLTKGTAGSDWQSTYEEFVSKMTSAGVDKVITELQGQVDEFLQK